jgi:hypothetical protein
MSGRKWVRFTSTAHGITLAHPPEYPLAVDGTEDIHVAGQPGLLVSLTPDADTSRIYVATTISPLRFHALTLVYPEDSANEAEGEELLRLFLTTIKLDG